MGEPLGELGDHEGSSSGGGGGRGASRLSSSRDPDKGRYARRGEPDRRSRAPLGRLLQRRQQQLVTQKGEARSCGEVERERERIPLAVIISGPARPRGLPLFLSLSRRGSAEESARKKERGGGRGREKKGKREGGSRRYAMPAVARRAVGRSDNSIAAGPAKSTSFSPSSRSPARSDAAPTGRAKVSSAAASATKEK